MTDDLTGKEKYEERRRVEKASMLRRPRLTPQEAARRLPAPILWTIVMSGWLLAIGEALVVGLGVNWDWTPKLTIEAQTNHFASNPLGTEFRVTNAGRVSLHNVRFECVIDKQTLNMTLKGNVPGQEPLSTFSSGDDVTRNCGTFFLSVPNAQTLDFVAYYEWAFNKSPEPATKHFVIRRGQKGEFYAVSDRQN